MELKIGDKVRNKINGKIGVIEHIQGTEDVDVIGGYYIERYSVLYSNRVCTFENTIMEIEKIDDILDEDEKEYISNIIKPFKERVESITKYSGMSTEYIEIRVEHFSIKSLDYVMLPVFKKGTMYKKMETDKKYTLKELNLD